MKNNFTNPRKAFSSQVAKIRSSQLIKILGIAALFICLMNINSAKAGSYSFSNQASSKSADSSCNASFYVTDSGNVYQFHNTATAGAGDNIIRYHWAFGDGDTSNSENPFKTYADTLGHIACLTIYTSGGCSSQICDTIIYGACTASFSLNYGSGNTVNFTNTSFSHYIITSYLWNFGDGDTSNAESPTHTYTTAGVYQVTLTIDASNGCSASFNENVTVPQATCHASFTYISSYDTSYFTSTSSTSNGTISRYQWYFPGSVGGDTGIYGGATDTAVYPGHGNYTACLYITTTTGCTSYFCDSVIIQGNCQAAFNYNYGSGNTVNFTDNSYSIGTITSYSWAFGDGGTSSAKNPSYTYTTPGTYTITLTIGASNGCTATTSESINVPQPACNASFTVTVSGDTAYFSSTSTSNGTITQYEWNFWGAAGDTGIHSGDTATAIYPPGGGTYSACLYISTNTGCSASVCDSVVILPNCSAGFTYAYGSGNTINFTSTAFSIATITSYNWAFGDGGTSTAPNPSYTYSTEGNYQVTLTIGASNGCTATFSENIQVPLPVCNASFTYVTSGDSVYFTSTSTSNGTILDYGWNLYGATLDTGTINGANVIGIYDKPGIYSTCLYIYTSNGCQSRFCDSITVTDSLTNNITGYVDCDQTASYPATVYLIKYDTAGGGTLTQIDTAQTDPFGDFSFRNVGNIKCLVKAAMDSGASNYNSCLPTYGENTLYWDSSAIYYSTSSNPFVTINMVGGSNPGGPGFIGGFVSKGANAPMGEGPTPDPDIEVLLLDANGHALEYRYSDISGDYTFSSLAYGTYELRVEYPGKISEIATVTITASNSSISSVNFTVHSTTVTTGFQNITSDPVNSIGEIYPNPTNGIANLQIQLNTSADYTLNIDNIIGQQVYSYSDHISAGNSLVNIPTTNLESGVYFVEIHVNNSATIVRKLIKE